MDDMHHAVVLLIGGLPGSGKTNLARQLAERILGRSTSSNGKNNSSDNNDNDNSHDNNNTECFHVEYDELEETILAQKKQDDAAVPPQDFSSFDHKNHNNNSDSDSSSSLEAWRRSRVVALEQVRTLLQTKRTNTNKLIVIMDDNFYLRSMRKQVFQICQEQQTCTDQLFFATIWLDAPVSVCQERNSDRQRRGNSRRKVEPSTIDRMHETCEPPKKGVATWEVNIKTIPSNVPGTLVLDQAFEFVQSLLYGGGGGDNDHVQPEVVPPPVSKDEELARLEQERSITRASKAHQLDQLSRQWVKALAQIKPHQAKTANKIRKHLLQDSSVAEKELDEFPKMFADRVIQASESEWTNDEIKRLQETLMT